MRSPQVDPGRGPQLSDFVEFSEARSERRFAGPQDFHTFSVDDYSRFWSLFLEWSDPLRAGDPEPVCVGERCETASFFPNLRLNYAENLLHAGSPADDERVALIARHGPGAPQRITRGELREQVRALAAHLREIGIEAGDRVVAIATNNAELIIGALASAAIGATFSSAAPEMGSAAILSRFEQLSPRLLMANLGPERAGPSSTLTERVEAVAASLPTLSAIVALNDGARPKGVDVPVLDLAELVASPPAGAAANGWERFPFNHPLFILFTSGTTGPPKCIVHGSGGTLLEHLKEQRLHLDLGRDDKLFFQTSAAWMMWNWQLSALACGSTIVVFDGSLEGPETLWRIVAEERVTVFGTSPPYLQLCEDSGYSPKREASLDRLRSILSTGSVLRDWQYDWVSREVGPVQLQSISGGTDIVGCFVLGHPELPVRRGMIQSRSLGLDVQALPTDATPPDSAVGELVCRNPFPSRPLGFLGDDGRRFHEAYFSQNDGVWTHGDLIEFDDDGQARIHGRSDGVLNIQGVRIGPSEIYQALREVPEVGEAMAVEQLQGGRPRLVLLVVLSDAAVLDGGLTLRIRRAIARQTTPLHVPELVVAVEELPLTHSGKRSERAGRDAVNGRTATNLPALRNPQALARIQQALERAEATRDERDLGPLAGAPTLERVRAIWENVLGIEGLADDDDFFAIGGTSLLAVRVFLLIGERVGAELPLSTLLEAPTVAELAALIDDPLRRSAPMVMIRPGAGDPPLFLVHSIWGDVIEMRQIALAIETDVPVYGLRARALNLDEEPQVSVEEMAADYVGVIRAAQPHGPYRVGGFSFGALIAFEIARQLAEQGEEIGWLGMIDGELSPACLSPARRRRYRFALPFHLLQATLRDPRRVTRTLFREMIPNAFRRGILRIFPSAPLKPPVASWQENASPSHRYMARISLEAAAAYRPSGYSGSMTYFVPEIRRLHLFPDPLPVWRRVTRGELSVESIPGPHVGMVSGEQARLVARRIDADLAG